MNQKLSHWMEVYRLEQHAQAALSALPAEERQLAVAEAMFHLNHMARAYKRSRLAEAIYDVKNDLVEHFYRAGYCTRVTRHVQTLPCYCEGDDDCWKCGGTGIYRQYTLYYFRFNINGQTFVWHQPERLVTWPVALSEPGIGSFEEREFVLSTPRGYRYDEAITLVQVYLSWYGLPYARWSLGSLPSVIMAIALEWLGDRYAGSRLENLIDSARYRVRHLREAVGPFACRILGHDRAALENGYCYRCDTVLDDSDPPSTQADAARDSLELDPDEVPF
jgi:hypothetical protein